jgi:branched-chain amino acid aminotransferase
MFAQGVGAISYRGERTLPTVKSLNMLVNTLARHAAQAAGENEGLLVDAAGNVREGATSTFYVVQGSNLLLPPPEDILEGVTLQIVLDLAAQAGIPVRRVALPLSGRDGWDEAFLTSTSRHVLPLVRLDGAPIGSGVPGPVTEELHRRFETYFAGITGRDYSSP